MLPRIATTRPTADLAALCAWAQGRGLELEGLAVEVVENPEWAGGMGTSIRAGIGHAEALGLDADHGQQIRAQARIPHGFGQLPGAHAFVVELRARDVLEDAQRLVVDVGHAHLPARGLRLAHAVERQHRQHEGRAHHQLADLRNGAAARHALRGAAAAGFKELVKPIHVETPVFPGRDQAR